MDIEHLKAQAHKFIPGGTHTLSKSMLLGGKFPHFPSHVAGGEGSRLYGVNGKVYTDFICGLGSVGLGYGYNSEAILDMLKGGVTFSMPHVLEVELAEILTSMIPFAEQVRLVKTGSEACQGAIRAARISTGRDKVVVSGYHGWHDWFAASLEPLVEGIPRQNAELIKNVQEYNIVALRNAIEKGDVACYMLEPCRNYEPTEGFLEQARALCDHYGTLMIFDEMLCGFRWALRGGSEYFEIVPDMAVYGKAMGNGFPIACIVGPEKYMKNTWPVSGTFSGDLCGIAAAIRTIQTYMMHSVTAKMWTLGDMMMSNMNYVIQRNGFYHRFRVTGYEVHPWFDGERETIFQVVNGLAEKGFLFHPKGFNIMYSHTTEDVNSALGALDAVLKEMS